VPLQVNATETIEAIAVASGYANSGVTSATYTITSGPVSVNLSASDNVSGIANLGSPVTGGGLDNGGYAYAANLIGTSISWSGATFTLGGAGVSDAVSNTTVVLPAGNYSSINLLATGVNNNQPNRTLVVTYTDGTMTSFTQSFSDWSKPQSYPGESIALSMAYRIAPNGVQANGAYYLYGYTFALNSAKIVKSLTLPATRNVVVLAIDLVGSGSSAAANPTVSPAAGTYSSTQTVTLSDTTPGAAIYYTTNGTAPTTASTQYSVPLQISTTTTLEAIAVASGYTTSGVTIATYAIAPSTVPMSVNLSASDNVSGIANLGVAVTGGGLDNGGYAYATNLIGTSINWSGATFTLGGAGVSDAVSNTTLALPAGNYSSINLLATGVNNNQPNRTFVVTYTDGTMTSFTQSLSDWFTPQSYPGESIALSMAYRVAPDGAASTNGPFNLYGYSFALNSGKIVKSLTLPATRNVVVLAIDLKP
jgi:hypothetical protein